MTWLRGLFPVRRDERGIVLLLYALLSVTVIANWVGKVGSNSIFIKSVGVTFLPVAYVIAPVVLLLASSVIFALVGRIRRRDLFMWYVGIVALLSVAAQVLLPVTSTDYWLTYVLAQVVKDTIYLVFWVYAGNLFDSEQSKRIFPLFAGSLLVGKIVGGLLAAALTPAIHSESFMAIEAAGFALAFVILVVYRRHLPEGEGAAPIQAGEPKTIGERLAGSLNGYKLVSRDTLLRPFGVNIFFWYFLMQIANYLFAAGLDAASKAGTLQQSQDDYTILYASVYTSGSLVALGIQTFITGGLIRRFGVSVAIFAFPIWYLVTFGAGTIFGLTAGAGLLIAILLQAAERIVIPAVHLPATQIIYTQVASSVRPRARAFFSGGLNAVAEIGAALVLVAGAISLSPQVVLGFGTICSAVFVANTVSLRRALGRRIVENLRSADPELQRNAAQMLHGERGAVASSDLEALLGEGSSADIEARVRHALTRRGTLRVVTESADGGPVRAEIGTNENRVPPVGSAGHVGDQLEISKTDLPADGRTVGQDTPDVGLPAANGHPIPSDEPATGGRVPAKRPRQPSGRAAKPDVTQGTAATPKTARTSRKTSRTTK
jgi:AAA family ATP:ADP antiporter